MSKRQRDIKSKLMAAICMLLVSSIMMVSTTYAWFTLSTAPEVTGVHTSIGANGNLEMALLPTNGAVNDVPESDAGDGNLEIEQKNLTWGNLVDVSNNEIYGTNQFKLYPSQLNATSTTTGEGDTAVTTTTIQKAVLSTPVYGADGRVSALKSETATSRYKENKFVENGEFGVRGIGNADGKTPRQAALTNALSSAAIYRSSAKDLASNSLSANGAVLGEVAIAAAMGGTLEQKHKDGMTNMIAGLKASLDDIEKAYKQYILAFAASSNVSSEAAWTTVSGMLESNSIETLLGLADFTGVAVPTELSSVVTKLAATRQAVAEAETALQSVNPTDVEAMKGVMAKLADPDQMKLYDKTIREAMNDKEYIIQKFGENSGSLALTILPEGGVYADIAEHAGDFSAGVTLSNIDVPGVGDDISVKASMSTVTAGTGKPYLAAVGTVMGGYSAPASSSEDLVISDFYGYIIDLAFRTNASNSKLQLQPDGIDRIYSGQNPGVDDANNINTMGNGASMTFSKGSDGFSDDQMKNLMKSIKIVFFTPDASTATTGTVVGYAALDADNATNTAEGMKAKLMMVDATGKATGSNDIMDLVQNTPTALSVLVYLDGNTVKNEDVAIGEASMVGTLNLQFSSSAALVPMDYTPLKNGLTADDDTPAAPAGTPLTAVTCDNGVTGVGAFDGSAVTINLTAPAGKAITDANVTVTGKTVSNDVYANGKLTFTCKNIAAGDAVAVTTTLIDVYNVTKGEGVTGADTVNAGADYTFTVADTHILGTVTVGETTVTPTDNGSGSYTIPTAQINGAIVINTTAVAGG